MNSKGKLLMLVLASLMAAPTAMAQSNTMPDNVRKRLESLSPEQRAQIEQRRANGGQRPPGVTPGQRPGGATPGQRPPGVGGRPRG